jgi:hypothetical protein
MACTLEADNKWSMGIGVAGSPKASLPRHRGHWGGKNRQRHYTLLSCMARFESEASCPFSGATILSRPNQDPFLSFGLHLLLQRLHIHAEANQTD